jgi:diguanylate cyclase (GGDEF)-like protein
VVLAARLRKAAERDSRMELTNDPEMLASLEAIVAPLDKLINQPWFLETDPYPMPRLLDFLTLKRVEATLGDTVALPERSYDEKFGILQAPPLILADLRYYRVTCGMRGASTSLAYLDIDLFKDLNSKHGDTTVDREILPRFMQALEAFAFARGHAYRRGGDEYVVTLPNTDLALATSEFGRLLNQLASLKYRVEGRTTVSAGVCVLEPDSFLTDREVVDRACTAKEFAKREGRNRLAAFHGPLVADSELYIAYAGP